MNLKLRLNIIITALLALVMFIGAVFMVRNARDDVRAEIESTTTLALHLLDAEILHYADYQRLNAWENNANSIFRLSSLDNVRHLRIEFFDPSGRMRESNHVASTQNEEVPSWFLSMMNAVSPSMEPTHRPVIVNQRLLGELVVTPDSSYEIAEIWNDVLNLLILGMVFFVVVNAMVYWAVDRALRPVSRILSALEELEKGNWEARLPNFTLPELTSISNKFNAMVNTLHNSVRNNHKLTQQIITLQEEERKNLARDLHDEIGQHLTAIHVDASAILKAKSLSVARESARAIDEVSRQMMDIVHDMLQRLRPVILEELGLNAALRELIDSWQQRNQSVRTMVSIRGHMNAPEDIIAIAVYRIVQECLTNITRHAQASNVHIEVDCMDDKLILSVQDDGRGFDTGTPVDGFGLAGMRERVEALGGSFNVNSSPDRGVRISVWLSLKGTA
jgi:two-component system sensor histidine kinase UhpB